MRKVHNPTDNQLQFLTILLFEFLLLTLLKHVLMKFMPFVLFALDKIGVKKDIFHFLLWLLCTYFKTIIASSCNFLFSKRVSNARSLNLVPQVGFSKSWSSFLLLLLDWFTLVVTQTGQVPEETLHVCYLQYFCFYIPPCGIAIPGYCWVAFSLLSCYLWWYYWIIFLAIVFFVVD